MASARMIPKTQKWQAIFFYSSHMLPAFPLVFQFIQLCVTTPIRCFGVSKLQPMPACGLQNASTRIPEVYAFDLDKGPTKQRPRVLLYSTQRPDSTKVTTCNRLFQNLCQLSDYIEYVVGSNPGRTKV